MNCPWCNSLKTRVSYQSFNDVVYTRIRRVNKWYMVIVKCDACKRSKQIDLISQKEYKRRKRLKIT